MIHNILTIAGSDSGGGAGIQADLKTFSALGCFGMSAITALTAQNTHGVTGVHPVPPEFVLAQLRALSSDIRIDAAKIGMLANAGIIEAVARHLREAPIPFLVLDTVMIAKGGHPLLQADAVNAIRTQLLPLASLITPNLPEAAALLAQPVATDENGMRKQGQALLQLGARAVLMKGGHLGGAESPDWLFTEGSEQRFTQTRIQTRHTHGTGCTLSAALAALRPQHPDWSGTLVAAQTYLQGALRAAGQLEVGSGIGPVQHFWRWWS